MKKFFLLALSFVCAYAAKAQTTIDPIEESASTTIVLNKKNNNPNRLPQKPAYRPVSCVVTGNEIDVYCQYEATGDILVVDSRTGMTVASENAVELGDGYTLYIPDQYAEAPLTIYVTIAGTTYWGEI